MVDAVKANHLHFTFGQPQANRPSCNLCQWGQVWWVGRPRPMLFSAQCFAGLDRRHAAIIDDCDQDPYHFILLWLWRHKPGGALRRHRSCPWWKPRVVAYSSNCPGRWGLPQPYNNHNDDDNSNGYDMSTTTHLSKRETTSAWPKEQALCKGIKPPDETRLKDTNVKLQLHSSWMLNDFKP